MDPAGNGAAYESTPQATRTTNDGGTLAQPLAMGNLGDKESETVLKINLNRVVTQKVLCQGKEVEAIVDSAAGVGVIDPDFARE